MPPYDGLLGIVLKTFSSIERGKRWLFPLFIRTFVEIIAHAFP